MASFSSNPLTTLFLALSVAATAIATVPKTFNVNSYGAVCDGRTDNSKAFSRAWEAACVWEGRARVVIPVGSYLTGPVKFQGPCKGRMIFQVNGEVVAPESLSAFPEDGWISFQYLDGLTINGRGKFDGKGASSWPHNQCPKNFKCKTLPTSLKFSFLNNSVVRGISSVDSKMFHMMVFSCHNLKFEGIRISAPADSPNTDGIHMGVSSGVSVTDSIIGTGDDCISIGPGTSDVSVSRVFCGPGHGISVGSLGKFKEDRDVTNLSVTNCTLTRTTNGVRIKSWQDSFSLRAANFTFDDIVMNDVQNPIIIDQEYCPTGNCNAKSPSSVKISDVKFRNIRGSSSTPVAVNLRCSQAVPCNGVELSNIDLAYGGQGEKATADCAHVIGQSIGTVIPPSCL